MSPLSVSVMARSLSAAVTNRTIIGGTTTHTMKRKCVLRFTALSN